MNKKVNILFKVLGGPNIGMGHVIRSLALAEEIKEDAGGEIFFHCNKDSRIIDKIKNTHKVLSTHDNDGIVSAILNNDINVLIIDQPTDDIEFCRLLKARKAVVLTSALDFFGYGNGYLDIIINLCNQDKNNPVPAGNFKGEYHEGIEYAILRRSFGNYIHGNKEINTDVRNILVTFGGVDKKRNTVTILNFLSRIKNKFKVDVVIGPLFSGRDEAIKISKQMNNWEIHEDTDDMAKLIFSADLAFIGGGTTLMECCALGTPAIVLPQTEREVQFSELFKKKGAIRILGDNLTDEEKIRLVTELFNNSDIRSNMSRKQKLMIDGMGKSRVKNIIMANYQKMIDKRQ